MPNQAPPDVPHSTGFQLFMCSATRRCNATQHAAGLLVCQRRTLLQIEARCQVPETRVDETLATTAPALVDRTVRFNTSSTFTFRDNASCTQSTSSAPRSDNCFKPYSPLGRCAPLVSIVHPVAALTCACLEHELKTHLALVLQE